MSWFFKLLDTAGTNQAGVDSNNNVKVVQPTTKTQAGYGLLASKVDGGGATARVNIPMVTEGGQLVVAPTVYLWDDTFNATAQNTAKYKFAATTQTGAMAGGYLVLNNGSITTINTNSAIQTWRTFPLFAKSELRCNMSVARTVAPQANCVEEMGLFTATLPGAAVPTDGIFFRWNASAELRGVMSFNGTETQTAAITSPAITTNHDYTIVVQTNTVVFYIDDVLVGVITLLTDAPSQGQPSIQASLPWTMRQYIGGSAPSLANQLKISDVFITLRGGDANKPWSEVKAGFGHACYQGQNGGTMGSLAQYANSTNPAAAVPTNTTAALGTGLGGLFHEIVTLAAPTDGIISSFQNPAGGVNQTPRTLYITAIAISGTVTVVMPATQCGKTWSIAYGHTAVSLATAESASFVSPTTKAPRRIPLGVCILPTSSAVGTNLQLFPTGVISFRTPIVVAPGEFFQVVNRNLVAAQASGQVLWTILVDGYFE
jgi:hypothetical protein